MNKRIREKRHGKGYLPLAVAKGIRRSKIRKWEGPLPPVQSVPVTFRVYSVYSSVDFTVVRTSPAERRRVRHAMLVRGRRALRNRGEGMRMKPQQRWLAVWKTWNPAP